MDEHHTSETAPAQRSPSAGETPIPLSLPMSTTRPIAIVTVGSQSDVGRERDQNQDSLMCFMPDAEDGLHPRRGWLFAVADGMGGYAAGEVASQIAVETLVQHYAASDAEDLAAVLQEGVSLANAAVCRRGQELGLEIIGTTLVCAAVRDDQLYIAHVGDSRAYLLRGEALEALTRDHSLVSEQLRQGLITEAEARESELRSVVTRALGMGARVQADISGPLTLHPDDVILLCSDGVCGYVPEDQIRYILQTHRATPQAAAELLVEAANAVGGFDNATAVVAHVSRIVHAPLSDDDAPTPDRQPLRTPNAGRSNTETMNRPPAGEDLEQTSDHLPALDAKPARQFILGWREAIPIIILAIALLAEVFIFTSGMRRNANEATPTASPSPAQTQTAAVAPALSAAQPTRTSSEGAPARQVTFSVSIAPQAPLITFTHLSAITEQTRPDAPTTITLTFRTNASLIQPTTFDMLLDAGKPEQVARIELAPQVNFNREEQVKIEALAETDTQAGSDVNTWSLGTFGLPSKPALRMRSRLTVLLALEPATPVQPGKFPVRLFIRWQGTGAIPGDFKPEVSQAQR